MIFFEEKKLRTDGGSQASRSRSECIRERSMKIDEDGMRASQAQDSLPNTPTNNVWPLTGRVIEDKTIQNVAEMRSEHINELRPAFFQKSFTFLTRRKTRHATTMTTTQRKRKQQETTTTTTTTTNDAGTLKSESGMKSPRSLNGMSSSCASPFLLQGFLPSDPWSL